jgi:hypothetical protein
MAPPTAMPAAQAPNIRKAAAGIRPHVQRISITPQTIAAAPAAAHRNEKQPAIAPEITGCAASATIKRARGIAAIMARPCFVMKGN